MSTSSLELRENRALDFFQNIVETVREPLVILDSDLRVTGASRSFYRTFNVTKEETEGERAGVFCCLANRTERQRHRCELPNKGARRQRVF